MNPDAPPPTPEVPGPEAPGSRSSDPGGGPPGEPGRKEGSSLPPKPWPLPLRLLGAYLVWSLVLGILMPIFNTLPMRQMPSTLAVDLSPRAREVSFEAEDGVVLKGFYSPPEAGRPMLLLQHGVRSNRDDVLPWGRILAGTGYGILAFDWRGHGLSGGSQIGFASSEYQDIRAADAFLDARPELSGVPRGVLAISMGASCFAQGAAELGPEYRCMVLDSPFGNLDRMVDSRLRPFGPLRHLPREIARMVSPLWTGVHPSEVRPEQNLAVFAPRPLLVLHGREDEVIPFSEGESLYNLYPGPKQSWFTDGDRHTMARVHRIETWARVVGGFLGTHLPGAPPVSEVVRIAPRGEKDPPAG